VSRIPAAAFSAGRFLFGSVRPSSPAGRLRAGGRNRTSSLDDEGMCLASWRRQQNRVNPSRFTDRPGEHQRGTGGVVTNALQGGGYPRTRMAQRTSPQGGRPSNPRFTAWS